MADGSAEYTKKFSLDLDFNARDGVVKTLQRRGAGQVRGLRRREDARAAVTVIPAEAGIQPCP